MLRFTSFGAVAVARADGTEPGSAASQRRVLALLALAAAGGPQGVTRDRAMALLWPESDTDRARHALSQTLYHTRTALGEPDLFLAGNEIRLNPVAISPDSWEFEAAVKAGDDERAAAIYAGPFLDGFYLPRSAEFEDWSSAQRRHFSAHAWAAIDRLGAGAEARKDWAAAVLWRQRLAAMDIASSRASLKLMEVYVRAGDPAAALRHADVHKRAVRAQFETDPDESITTFEASIRAARVVRTTPGAGTPATAADVSPLPAAPAPAAEHKLAGMLLALPEELAVQTSGQTGTERVASRSRMWRWATAVVAAAAALAVWFAGSRPDAMAGSDSIVVAPFRVSGADADMSFLRAGMVELLTTRLRGERLPQPVDAGRAADAWRDVDDDDVGADYSDAIRLAKDLGVSGVVTGSVVGGSDRVHITASFISAATGRRELQVSATGAVDSINHVVDRLAIELLAAMHGEADRLSRRSTPPLAGLRSYIAGQIAYRRGEYQEAARQYENALRADSTFALAAFQLALTSDRLNSAEQHRRALAIAWIRRDELSPRDRDYLTAFAGPNYPRPSSASETMFALGGVVNLRPLRSDTWYEFGERMLRQGPLLALDDASRRAMNAFARALELDPSDRTGARPMMIVAAARNNDTAAVRRHASPAAVQDSMRNLAPFVQWTAARVLGDDTTLADVRTRLPELDAENLRLIAMSSLYDGVLRADGERAAMLLGRRSVGTRGLDALLAQHAFALAAGRADRALAITERIAERFPGVNAHLRLRVLDAVYGRGDSTAAGEAARALERSLAHGGPHTDLERAVYFADLCALEQWRLHNRTRSSTRETIAKLQGAGIPTTSIAISANPHACAALLHTWLAVETDESDARAQVLALDSLLLGGPAAGDAARYVHILLARLHLRFGDTTRALSALRRRSYLTGWPRYARTVRATETALRPVKTADH